jgi:hypothetical protein
MKAALQQTAHMVRGFIEPMFSSVGANPALPNLGNGKTKTKKSPSGGEP